MCCKSGAHILSPQYNPPLDAEYLVLRDPHFSHDSRLLNATLARGTQGSLARHVYMSLFLFLTSMCLFVYMIYILWGAL